MRYALFFALWLVMGCQPAEQGPLIIDGSNGVRPLLAAVVKSYLEYYPERAVELGEGMPTDERLPALDQGRIDLIMASHGLDADSLSQAGYDVYRFARMPVVFAAPVDLNVEVLRSPDLCAIFKGEINNWSAVGGPEEPIRPFVRPKSEVDMEVVEKYLPCFRQMTYGPEVVTRLSSVDMARSLQVTPGSLGITTMTRVLQSEGKLRALAIDGIMPSYTNMQSNNYQLMRDAFVVAPPRSSEKVAHFLQFLETEGLEVILRNRAYPLTRAGF